MLQRYVEMIQNSKIIFNNTIIQANIIGLLEAIFTVIGGGMD